MVATFSKASCVAAGAFNIYIIQPQWLTQVKILGPDEELLVESNFSEPGFRFRSQKSSFQWTVSPTRIAIESTDPSEDCGEIIARILALLPHTPLKAIGNNAFYRAPLEESKETALCQVPTGYEVSQRSWHTGLLKSDALYNIQKSITQENIGLHCNVHFKVEDKGSEFVQACARRFFENRSESEALLSQVFKVQIEHVTANA